MGCALYGHFSGCVFAACSSCRINYNKESLIKRDLGVLSSSWKMSNHLALYLTSHFRGTCTVKFFRWNIINTLRSSALKVYRSVRVDFSFHHPQTQTNISTHAVFSWEFNLLKNRTFKTNITTVMDRTKSLVEIRWCKPLDCGRNLEYLEEVRNIQTPHRRMERRSLPLHCHTTGI